MLLLDFICIGAFTVGWGLVTFVHILIAGYKEAKKKIEADKLLHISRLSDTIKSYNASHQDTPIKSFSVHFPDEDEPRKFNIE